MAEVEKEENKINNFIKAGKIAGKIIKESQSLVLPGQSALDIAETIEKMIIDYDGKLGFPVNVSINETAAHYTPDLGEEVLIEENDIVKIDFGVNIKGCISDNAYTIDLSDENQKLVEASDEALKAAISSVRPGKKTGEIGAVIENEITKRGFKPISNLTGHMILPYQLHAGPVIPNVKSEGGYKLQEGDVFAIEPFATTGNGIVKNGQRANIYSISELKNVRLRKGRQIFAYALKEYFTLPFAKRWLQKEFQSKALVSLSLKNLVRSEVIHAYPVLIEEKKGLVSQTERTVIIEKDGAKILD